MFPSCVGHDIISIITIGWLGTWNVNKYCLVVIKTSDTFSIPHIIIGSHKIREYKVQNFSEGNYQ